MHPTADAPCRVGRRPAARARSDVRQRRTRARLRRVAKRTFLRPNAASASRSMRASTTTCATNGKAMEHERVQRGSCRSTTEGHVEAADPKHVREARCDGCERTAHPHVDVDVSSSSHAKRTTPGTGTVHRCRSDATHPTRKHQHRFAATGVGGRGGRCDANARA